MTDLLLKDAWRAYQAGAFVEAARLYENILRANPQHFDALYLLGFVNIQLQHYGEAERLLGEAVRVNPTAFHAFLARGSVLLILNRREEAVASFDAALSLEPYSFDAHYSRGVTLLGLGLGSEALASFDKALAIQPRNLDALTNRALALLELKRHQEALSGFDNTLAIDPKNFAAWNNRGSALLEMRRYEDALNSFDTAIAIAPDSAGAFNNRGQALQGLQLHEEALSSFDKALAIEPTSADVLINRAWSLFELGRFEEAQSAYEKLLSIDPDYKYARGCLIHCKRICCEWTSLAEDRDVIARALRAGKRAISPFMNLPLAVSPEDQLQCSRIYVRNEHPPSPTPVWRGERYRHDRIRIAYVSADFRAHPVSFLMAGVFERHDRSRFETIAISFGPDDKSEIRERVKGAFEHFVDASFNSDAEIIALLRRLEVDIAIDLMGFSGLCRSGIFAARAAPVQVNYLGLPSTMGAEYIDYIVADRTAILYDQQRHYSEKVVYLPDTYLPADTARPISATPSRSEAGLPEDGFVFCSFNNSYKFSPEMFDVWMRLLGQVEGSVLWLPQSNQAAMRNLKREAEARGVAADRLVFAPFLAKAQDHLARLKLADLFLDTLPYNAHATAVDALWSGLPVLTCLGAIFPGRVAASVLRAAGLPELVADSIADYEAMALELAREPALLAAVKAKLAYNRHVYPLFDTERFTRNLEAAYTTMWERHQQGEAPGTFAVG